LPLKAFELDEEETVESPAVIVATGRRHHRGARGADVPEGTQMSTLRRLWRSHLRTVLFASLGALAGVVYYETVGCRTGGT